MNYIFDPQQRQALSPLFSANALLTFDYDGTLAPIASSPAEARMRPATLERLARVARRYPVVIITGRARHDVLPSCTASPIWKSSATMASKCPAYRRRCC